MSITHFSGPVAVGSGSYKSLTGAYTVTTKDNGVTFGLNGATDGALITLPSVAVMGAGFRFRVRVEAAFATTDWTITATAAIIVGTVNELETDTASDGPSTTGATTVTLVATAETVGDVYDFECNGTNLYLVGQCVADGAVTFS